MDNDRTIPPFMYIRKTAQTTTTTTMVEEEDGGHERQSLLSRIVGGFAPAAAAAAAAHSSSAYGSLDEEAGSGDGGPSSHRSLASRDGSDATVTATSDTEEEEGGGGEGGESHEIGYLGSFSIAINSLAGPAVLQLPFQYQQSGFVITTLALCGVAVLSVACSLYVCRVVQSIPSAAKVERPIELSTAVRYFWGRRVSGGRVLVCLLANSLPSPPFPLSRSLSK
jgi:hypothetical protein